MGIEISSVEDLSNNISFIRWVKGTGSPEEVKRWDRWLQKSRRNEELAKKAQQNILGIEFIQSSNSNSNKQSEWEQLENRINKKNHFVIHDLSASSKKSGKSSFWKIAAIILIAATTGFISHFLFSEAYSLPKESAQVEWKTIETEFQQQKTIVLSDGSTITLNANSSINYPAGWVRGNVTEVYLEGEAYFDITSREKGEEPPFKVITDDGVIEVMGTRFVVANSEKDTRVGLEEGKVSIQKINNVNGSLASEKHTMEPNDMAHFSRKARSVSIQKEPNIRIFTSWIDNELVLDSSPFRYLVYRIQQIYGVDVVVNNKKLYERTLTGRIKLKDLGYLTQSVSEVMKEEVFLSEGTVYFGENK